MRKRKLLLVDGHSVLHRAYHAYPKTFKTKKGELTNAIYGFTSILLSNLKKIEPSHLAIAFDLPKPTFRHIKFVGYKTKRKKPDEELIGQIDRIKQVVRAMNIPIYEVEGYEADDVIGTLSKQVEEDDQAVILTSDRDALQLIEDDKIVVFIPGRFKVPDKIWDQNKFEDEWKFTPRRLIEYKALAGDKSDDIPGVKGIGDKGARELVSRYGRLEKVYQNLEELKPTLIKKLAEDQEMAQLSRELATIDTDVPIDLDWKETEIHRYNKEEVAKLFKELGFNSLMNKLPDDLWEKEVQEVLF